MARLANEVLRERLYDAVFDSIDYMEADFSKSATIDSEVRIIVDAVFNVLNEIDTEELDPFTVMDEGDDEVLDEPESNA